jgi:hypothetical protein
MFLFKPELGTNSWLPIKTTSSTASDQGMRYYNGAAWYRCTVGVPAKYKGRKLRAWFGGVDGDTSVWINGKPLTLLQQGAKPFGNPWEFDATDAVKPGGDNVVVVRAVRTHVNELGTFGINGPAMIWAEAP